MAASSKAAVIRATILALLLCASAAPEPTLSLADAAARKPPDFTPLYEDRLVGVTGQVSKAVVRLPGFLPLPPQERGHGLGLEGRGALLDHLSPGRWVEARGRIFQRGGRPGS